MVLESGWRDDSLIWGNVRPVLLATLLQPVALPNDFVKQRLPLLALLLINRGDVEVSLSHEFRLENVAA